MGADGEASSPRPLPWWIAAIAAAVLISQLWTFHSFADDAYISFRYLDNWLAGHGLVFNPGERVEGYSNFLWIVLLLPLRWAGLAVELAALGLSLASLFVLLWAVFRTSQLVLGDRFGAGWAVVLLAMFAPVGHWTVSGMETVFYTALIALANWQLATLRKHTWKSSLILGCIALTRPEGVMFGLLAFLCAAVYCVLRDRSGFRTLSIHALLFTLFPLAQVMWRYLYYGSLLPNTYYAKLGGDLPTLIPGGLIYLFNFLLEGGVVIVLLAVVGLRRALAKSWIGAFLFFQVVLQMTFSVWVGGDYFPFHRFLVPVTPALAVLGGIGISSCFDVRRFPRWATLALLSSLLAIQVGLAQGAYSRRSFEVLTAVREEREQVADWLLRGSWPGQLLAVNAAGLIPYRTGWPTIDMLGLNDKHIARGEVGVREGGSTMVGHFKHDGDYVCSRSPDVVLLSGATLHPGRREEEAVMQSVLNTFPGDREFLQSAECREHYTPVSEELTPSRFAVAFARQSSADATTVQTREPTTAQAWFDRGVELMARARLQEAVQAFSQSLRLRPGHPGAMVNLGFCLLDLQRYQEAREVFEDAYASNPGNYDALYGLAQVEQASGNVARASDLWRRYIETGPEGVWKDRARERLRLLGGEIP